MGSKSVSSTGEKFRRANLDLNPVCRVEFVWAGSSDPGGGGADLYYSASAPQSGGLV